MEDAKAEKFDVIIVDDPNRLSRDLVTFLKMMEELHNHRVCVALASKDLDTSKPVIRSMISRMNYIYDEQLDALLSLTPTLVQPEV